MFFPDCATLQGGHSKISCKFTSSTIETFYNVKQIFLCCISVVRQLARPDILLKKDQLLDSHKGLCYMGSSGHPVTRSTVMLWNLLQ